MGVRDTSLAAWVELQPKLGKKQATAYNTIKAYPNKTDLEYCKILGYPDPNMFRPRRKELLDAQLIVDTGKRVCTVSGKMAHTWKAIGWKTLQ